MKFFLITLLTLIALSLFSSPIGQWQNQQKNIKVHFKANGTFTWQVNQNQMQGQWRLLNTQVLQTYINGQYVNYGFMIKGDMLGLQAVNGAQLYLRRVAQKSTAQKSTAKTTKKTSYKPLTDAQFMYFLQHYANMHPNTVYTYMTKLSKNQQSWIPIFKAWYNMMVYIACQGNLAYRTTREQQMCANSKRQYQQHLQLLKGMPASLGNDPWSHAKNETSKLLIFYKCQYGLIDKGSCKMYGKVQQNMNKMHNDTTKAIIKNLEPIPCTKHYEQRTNRYLGCY